MNQVDRRLEKAKPMMGFVEVHACTLLNNIKVTLEGLKPMLLSIALLMRTTVVLGGDIPINRAPGRPLVCVLSGKEGR